MDTVQVISEALSHTNHLTNTDHTAHKDKHQTNPMKPTAQLNHTTHILVLSRHNTFAGIRTGLVIVTQIIHFMSVWPAYTPCSQYTILLTVHCMPQSQPTGVQ